MSVDSWKKVRLGDVVIFNPKESLPKGSMSKKVAMDKISPSKRKVNEYTIEKYNGGSKFRNGDTLFARITPCLENGKTAQIDFLEINEVAFGSTEFIVLREKENKTINDFIYYHSISDKFRDIAIKSMVGTSGRQRVQQAVLENLEINLPPLHIQKAIADILSSLDDKIELNNRINANLEAQAQAIFKQWFVDFDFPNDDGNPYQSSGGEMIESELGEIPKEWRVGTFNDFGAIVGGSTPSKEKTEYFSQDGIAWITPKDLSNNKNKYIARGEKDITLLGLKNSSAKIMPKNTVLFSSRAPIGYIAISINEITTNQGFKSIVPYDNIGTAYVYFYLKNNLELIENRAIGSTFKEVSSGIMKTIPALVPMYNSLLKFQKPVNIIFGMQQKLEQENQKLATIRDALLPKLMSGEIQVNKENYNG